MVIYFVKMLKCYIKYSMHIKCIQIYYKTLSKRSRDSKMFMVWIRGNRASHHTTPRILLKWIFNIFTTFKYGNPNHLLGPFSKLQVKGNLFVCSQIWTIAKNSIFISNYFNCYFPMITPFFSPILKMFCDFSLKLDIKWMKWN